MSELEHGVYVHAQSSGMRIEKESPGSLKVATLEAVDNSCCIYRSIDAIVSQIVHAALFLDAELVL